MEKNPAVHPARCSSRGFVALVDLTKHFAQRCRPQQIANALWSFAVLMFQPLGAGIGVGWVGQMVLVMFCLDVDETFYEIFGVGLMLIFNVC